MVAVLGEDATATDAELDALNRGSLERDRLEDVESLRWWAEEGAQAEYQRAVRIGLAEAVQRGDQSLLERLIPQGIAWAVSRTVPVSNQAKILKGAAGRSRDDLAVALGYLVVTGDRMLLRVLLEALGLHDLVAAAARATTSQQRKEVDHRAKRLVLNGQLHGMVRPAVRCLVGLTPIPVAAGSEVF